MYKANKKLQYSNRGFVVDSLDSKIQGSSNILV